MRLNYHHFVCLGLTMLAGGCQPAPDPAARAAVAGTDSSAVDVSTEVTDDVVAEDASGSSDSATQANAEKADAEKPNNNHREIIEITFEDLNLSMKEDMVFRPWLLTDRVKGLEDQKVRVSGYMLPHDRQTGIRRFVLLRNTECKFGPGGQADHLIDVKLQGDVSTRFHTGVVEVEGVLRINPFTGPDGNTWSLYDLEGTRVKLRRK